MKNRIMQIIAEQFEIDLEDLNEDMSFSDDLEADSIQIMELIMELEEEFDTEFDEEDIESIETIGDVIGYIENM